MRTIIQQAPTQCNTYFNQKAVCARKSDLKKLSFKARSQSKRPLSKLQFILLLIIKEDCKIQGYSNRKVPELALMSGYSERGVKAALKVLHERNYLYSKKQTRGYATVRAISREGLSYSPSKFRKNNKSAPQSAPQKKGTLYKISYSGSEKENKDLLARDSIIKTLNREEECFRALDFGELDELIVLNAIKRSQLSLEARLRMATMIMNAHYKKPIEFKRAYYMTAIENEWRT